MIEILMPSGSQRHHGSIGISIAIKLFQDSKNLKPFKQSFQTPPYGGAGLAWQGTKC